MSGRNRVLELLEQVRAPYFNHFNTAIRDMRRTYPKILVQPFLCDPKSLTPIASGELKLPHRQDVAVITGETSAVLSIDSKQQPRFEPLRFSVEFDSRPCEVTVAPFTWDGAQLVVQSSPQSDLDWTALTECFREHLMLGSNDTSDAPLAVLHFLSDPEPCPEGFRFEVDLGTAPADVALDLLFAALESGSNGVQLR